jgi:hypothetical protein
MVLVGWQTAKEVDDRIRVLYGLGKRMKRVGVNEGRLHRQGMVSVNDQAA